MEEHLAPVPGTTITPHGEVTASTEPASPSTRRLSWHRRAALVAALLLAVVLGVVLLINRPLQADVTQPDIRAATYAYQQYVESLRNDSVEQAYELTSPEYQAQNPKNEFMLTQQARKDQGYLKGDYLITNVQTQGQKVLITARFQNDKNETVETTTTLIFEDNRWLVAPSE